MAERLFQVGIKGLVTNKQSKILLVQGQNGRWDIPGGRMDQNESFRQTLTRELSEEIGVELSGNPEHFDTILSNVTIQDNSTEYGLVLVIYLVSLQSEQQITLGVEEVASEWVSIEVAVERLSNKYPQDFLSKLVTL